MNYKVLYRKYRPNNFESIIGQDYIVKTLKNSIVNNMVSHAYIFSGPRGTGKTSTAKVFAKAVNCLNPIDGSPCGSCEFCTNFVENPDVIEIDAASNNGVDEIRNLIDNVKLTPSNGKYKVYIIDEVHMLTTSAFNALLLTLEEPPAHVIFVLATTNIENVPITILSRCQRFDFRKITVNDIVFGLKRVCDIEKISYDESAMYEIAYLAEGGMRDALSILDQLSKNKQEISIELVETQIKTISEKRIKDMLKSVEDNEFDNVFESLKSFEERGTDYKTLVKKMIDILSTSAKNIKKTGKYNRLDFDKHKKLILNLTDSLTRINVNVNPFITLELILLDVMETKEIAAPQNDTETVETTSLQSKDVNSIYDKINIRINNCFVNAQKKYLDFIREKIDSINYLTITNKKIHSLITDNQVVAASNNYIIFTTMNEHLALVANEEIKEIEKLLKGELDLDYKVIFISSERWKNEKQKYIENIKLNKKYEYISDDDQNDETEISSVFDKAIVEII